MHKVSYYYFHSHAHWIGYIQCCSHHTCEMKYLIMITVCAVVVLVYVQGVQNEGPHSQYKRLEDAPNFGLRAYKDS